MKGQLLNTFIVLWFTMNVGICAADSSANSESTAQLSAAQLERALADLSSASAKVRERAVRQLSGQSTATARCVPALRQAIADDSMAVKLAAIQSLKSFGEAAVPAVADLLTLCDQNDQSIAEEVTRCVVAIGPTAVPSLTASIEGASLSRQRVAVRILGCIGPESAAAVPTLLALLGKVREETRANELRVEICQAISSIAPKDPSAVGALIDCLRPLKKENGGIGFLMPELQQAKDSFRKEFGASATALAAIGPAAAEATPILLDFLALPPDSYHDSTRRRCAAVTALSRFGKTDPKIIDALVRALENQGDSTLSATAAVALGKLGVSDPDRVVPALIEHLRGFSDIRSILDRGGSRERTLEALGNIGKPAIPSLRELLRDKNLASQRNAIVALGLIGPDAEDAIGDIAKLLSREESDVGNEVMLALMRIGQSALPEVRAAIRSPSTLVRSRAIVVAGVLAGQNRLILPELEAATNESDPFVRAAAIAALQRQNRWTPTISAVLIERLNDPERIVRRNAADALIAIGTKSVPALVKIAARPADARSHIHRVNASFVLGELTNPAHIEYLDALAPSLRDRDDRIRCNVTEAIGRMGPAAASALPTLRDHLNSSDKFLSCTAALAIARISPEDRPAMADRLQQFVLGQGNHELAVYATKRLGGMPPSPTVTTALATAVTDAQHGYVRVDAALALAESLGRAAPPATVKGLLEGFDYSDRYSRLVLVQRLARLGPGAASAVPKLLELQVESKRYGSRFLEFENTYSVELVQAVGEALNVIDPHGRFTRLAILSSN